MAFKKDKLKKQIVSFAEKGVKKFLKENPDLEFYAFAFDCNAEYAEINLCFNTEKDFQKTLKHYQDGEFSESYQSEADINELKFNTGDWEYQCFETLHVLNDKELDKISQQMPNDDDETWNEFVNELLELFTESVIDFTKTETFSKIPKTEGFIAFCIDHDEDVDTAMERLEKYRQNTFRSREFTIRSLFEKIKDTICRK